jgi:hypothetical protein
LGLVTTRLELQRNDERRTHVPTPELNQPAQPGEDVPVQFAHEVIQTGDGRTWGRIRLGVGPAEMALALPEATLRNLAAQLPGLLTAAADAVRRQKLGLIVPGNGHTTITPDQAAALRNGGPR